MQVYFAEENRLKRDEIALRQLHALREHQGPGEKTLRLSDVKEMFRQMKGLPTERGRQLRRPHSPRPSSLLSQPALYLVSLVPLPTPCRPVRTLDIRACANLDQQSWARHRPASCESRNWGSETARSCEGNEIPAFDAPPLDQAGAQHSQSPITAEGGAVIRYTTPANMAGSRRKSVIWDTISIGGTVCCRVRASAKHTARRSRCLHK